MANKSLGARFSFCIALILLATVGIYMAYATDPSPLQDFCVGVTDPNTARMARYKNTFICYLCY